MDKKFHKHTPPQMRVFECEVCGGRSIAPKRRCSSTANGHIKHMYCWRCKDTTKHIQIDVL